MSTAAKKIICPSCGFANTPPLANNRCVSCGAKVEDLKRVLTRQEELEKRYQQENFSLTWFVVSILIMLVTTAAFVMGLPMVVPALDFEGSAGMMVSIPVWFFGGMLIGLVSPGRTFIEPMVAVFLVAIPTALVLYSGQTVKTMPAFMYVLLAGLGVLFTLIGAYMGERVQTGPPPKVSE
jgi:predicted nucleic acid-binding Zn ribbon protein